MFLINKNIKLYLLNFHNNKNIFLIICNLIHLLSLFEMPLKQKNSIKNNIWILIKLEFI